MRGKTSTALIDCQAKARSETGGRRASSVVNAVPSGNSSRMIKSAGADALAGGGRRLAAPPDPRRRGGHPRGPRSSDRPGALDGRPAGGGAARARAGLRVRRTVLHRGAPADGARLQQRGRGCVLVADLGATHSRLAVTDLAGTRSSRNAQDLDIARRAGAGARAGWTSASPSCSRRRGRRAEDVRGIGLGVPGPVAFASGRPVSPPIMPGWDGFSLPDWFAEPLRRARARRQRREHHGPRRALGALARLRAPAVRQGRHRHRLGHRRRTRQHPPRRAGRGRRHRPHPGPGPRATWCAAAATRGCLEAVAGGRALAERLAVERRATRPSTRDVVRLVRAGDPRGDRRPCGEAGRSLGEVLAGCVNFFNPSVIVIGGDLGEATSSCSPASARSPSSARCRSPRATCGW